MCRNLSGKGGILTSAKISDPEPILILGSFISRFCCYKLLICASYSSKNGQIRKCSSMYNVQCSVSDPDSIGSDPGRPNWHSKKGEKISCSERSLSGGFLKIKSSNYKYFPNFIIIWYVHLGLDPDWIRI